MSTRDAHVLESERDVPAGGSREFRFDPESVVRGSPWLTDRRMAEPGPYELRALFSGDLTADGGSEGQIAEDGEFDHSKVLASNYATLTVSRPFGEDLVVWEWMKAHDSPVPDGFPEFPSFVIDHHLSSGYALYAAAWYPKRDRAHEYALLEGVIKRFPSSSLTEQLKARLMYTHRDDAGTAYQRHDLQRAVAEWDKARELATDLAQNGRSSKIRRDAKELGAIAPSREQILAPPPADE